MKENENLDENKTSEPAEEAKTEINLPKKKKKKGKIVLIVLLILAVLVGAGWIINNINNDRLEKNFYQIKSTNVLGNIRIVAIADMHLKEFGNNNETLINEIDKLNPDIIAIVGDMNLEQKPDDYDIVLTLCKGLKPIAPVYYCLGNHEFDAMLFQNSKIYRDVKALGIHILNNEMETATINGTPIDIIGLSQGPGTFREYGKEFFDKAISADNNFKLVLNHYPEMYQGVLNDYDIDLMIAGHAHGGQIRLPWIGGIYAADQGFFPKLCDGYHEIDNGKLLITRGLGTSGWLPRVNNTPEILVADIGWY